MRLETLVPGQDELLVTVVADPCRSCDWLRDLGPRSSVVCRDPIPDPLRSTTVGEDHGLDPLVKMILAHRATTTKLSAPHCTSQLM